MGPDFSMGRDNFEGGCTSLHARRHSAISCAKLQIAACKGATFEGKDVPKHARRHSVVSCAKIAEPIEMPFGLWTRLGSRQHVLRGVHIGAT